MTGRSGHLAVVPARAIDDSRLSPAALRVLVTLATYGDRDGWCWPSVTTIAARLGISRRAVTYQQQELTRLGYLQTKRRYDDHGAERSAVRRILYDAALPAGADRAGGQRGAAGGGNPSFSGGGGNPSFSGGEPLSFSGGEPLSFSPERPSRTTQVNAAAVRAGAHDAGGGGTPADISEVLTVLQAAQDLEVHEEAVRSVVAAHPGGDATQAAHVVAAWAAEPGLRCRTASRLLHRALTADAGDRGTPPSAGRERPKNGRLTHSGDLSRFDDIGGSA